MKFYKIVLFVFVLIFTTKRGSSAKGSIISDELFHKLAKFYTFNSNNDILDTTCAKQTAQYFLALTAQPPKAWAIKMFDASSKMQSGIMAGNLRELGAFDQCLSIDKIVSDKVTISGKHCYGTLTLQKPGSKNGSSFSEQEKDAIALINLLAGPNQKMRVENEIETRDEQTGGMNIGLKWSICVPDGCSAKQIQRYVQNLLFGKNSPIKFKLKESNCQSAETIKPKLRTGDWVFVGFLIVILVFLVSSTVYDIYLQLNKKRTLHPILLAFSVLTNGKRLIAVNKSPEQLPCLHGMRWFSMMWVLLGHRYMEALMEPLVNTFSLLKWQKKFLSQLQLGSTVSVDTFFMLSGCLLMYGFLKAMTKKIPFNIPLFYIHRYLRLTPALAVLIAFQVTILRYMGSGPRWPTTVQSQTGCEDGWWKTLLYIQNYYSDYGQKAPSMCVMQAWYLSIDMQLYWLSPLVLLPVWHFKRFAWLIMAGLVCIFTAVPTVIAYQYKLDGWGMGGDADVYYMKTHTRAGTWLVGICLGYVLFYTRGKKISMDKRVLTLLWIISTVVALYVLFGMYPSTQDGYVYKRWFSTIFVGFHRVVWCLVLSWIIFACVHGYGGPVNWILSLPMFQVLGRFTYSMYLAHITLQQMRGGVLRSPGHFSNLDMWYIFWGDLIFCLIIAVVWVLAFESPVGVIDNVLLGGAKTRKTQAPNDNSPKQTETADAPTNIIISKQTMEDNNNELTGKNMSASSSTAKEDLSIDMSSGNENLALDVTTENLQSTNSQQDPPPYEVHHRNINSKNKE